MSRQRIDFNIPHIEGVLPEFFGGEYPKFIEFLNTYMQFMEDKGYNRRIRDIKNTNDASSVDESYLDELLYEVGSDTTSKRRRDLIKGFPEFYRGKGTLNGIRRFFRDFYDEDVDVEYPKNNLFIVGESTVGVAGGKVIQDGRLHQILSILVKSSTTINDWGKQYRRMMHPAGFYLGSSLSVTSFYDLGVELHSPASVNEDVVGITRDALASAPIQSVPEQWSATYEDLDGNTYTVDIDRRMKDMTPTIDELDEQYDSIKDLSALNRPMWSSDKIGFSSDYEQFSAVKYK